MESGGQYRQGISRISFHRKSHSLGWSDRAGYGETVMKQAKSGISRRLFVLPIVSLGVVLSMVLAHSVLWGPLKPVHAPLKVIEIGMPAPDIHLPSAQGDTYHLADLRGQAVLLSFVNSRPPDASLSTPDVSRSQIVFLKNIAHQYEPEKVQVLLVDATALVTGEQPDRNAILNFARNWDMETIPVLIDGGTTAQAYGISNVPTTLLIAPDGRVTHRWDGFVSAAQLAFAVQSLVGLPDFGARSVPLQCSVNKETNL